jgi:hypothetical protein
MKFKLVPWVQEAHGKSGDTVFREVKGETIVAQKPGKKKTPFSEKQVEVQANFTDAADYYNMVMLVPELLALYQQAASKAEKTVFKMCQQDWFDSPQIRRLQLEEYEGKAGGVIKFMVKDEIPVEKVIVTLSDEEEGTVIEKGLAVPVQAGTNFWMYTATTSVPAGKMVIVEVIAYDHPGNKGRLSGVANVN